MSEIVYGGGTDPTRRCIGSEKESADSKKTLHHLFWIHPDDFKGAVDMKIPVNERSGA